MNKPAAAPSLIWIDVIRFLASFGIVFIHVAADVIAQYDKVPRLDWWLVNLLDSLVRGCVCLFIMVSGALLLMPSEQSIGDFFKKRLNRILIPFLVWSVLYLVWKKYLLQADFSWSEGFSRIAKNQVHFHLWFFYALIGIYLVTPILRIFVRYAKPAHVLYFVGLWFVLASIWPFAQDFSKIFLGVKPEFYLPVGIVQGMIGYFVLGYYLRAMAPAKIEKHAPWAAFITLGVCIAGTYAVCLKTGYYHVLFYENTAPNVAIYAAALFLIAKSTAPQMEAWSPRAKSILGELSKASFGVYLMHPMVMEAVEKGRLGFKVSPLENSSVLTVLGATGVIYLISLAVTLVVLRVPFLRRTV